MGRVELTPYLERLSADLGAVAAPGGPATAEAAARLAILDVLAAAAEEITARLGGATVEVRLRGPDADLVVTRPVAPAGPLPDDDGDLARLTLRLPEALRTHVEQTAAVEGISVNTWLVRAVTVAVSRQHGPPPAPHGAWAGVSAG